MDAKKAMQRHEQQAQEENAADDVTRSGDPADQSQSRNAHPTIAAALGFGPNNPKLSPSKDGKRYPCSLCNSTFTRFARVD